MGLPSTLCISLAMLFALLASAQKDNGEGCSCFTTNGTDGYFTNHQFRDFRNIDGVSSTIPSLITDGDDTTNALATSDYFLQDEWTSMWTTQNWNNSDSMEENSATVLMINSPNNVYLEQSTDKNPAYKTYLTMRTSRLSTFQSASEIDTVEQNFQFLSARFLARVIGSPGACAGIFTYLSNDDPSKVQEADIEILTQGPRNVVQYTNQPSDSDSGNPISDATSNATNPGGRDWTLWNTYRVDWTPKMVSWYVNGESAANISFQAPGDPAGFIVNMWSDGGLWTGNMSRNDEAYLQIQWLQLVYNTSGPYEGSDAKRDFNGRVEARKEKGCQVVCSVDEETEATVNSVPGKVALLYNNTGMAPGTWKGEGMGALAWMPVVLVGAAVFGLF